jgi:hypothetical protein
MTSANDTTAAPKDHRRYGAKYDRNLSRTAIAGAYRADIKAAIAAGELPKGLKVSVRCRRSGHSGAIDQTVTAVPEGFAIINPARVTNPHGNNLRHTPEAAALLRKLHDMLDAYDYDGSDSMSDYYDHNFYGNNPDFASELEDADRARIAAAVDSSCQPGGDPA